jgi:hypothetical protein
MADIKDLIQREKDIKKQIEDKTKQSNPEFGENEKKIIINLTKDRQNVLKDIVKEYRQLPFEQQTADLKAQIEHYKREAQWREEDVNAYLANAYGIETYKFQQELAILKQQTGKPETEPYKPINEITSYSEFSKRFGQYGVTLEGLLSSSKENNGYIEIDFPQQIFFNKTTDVFSIKKEFLQQILGEERAFLINVELEKSLDELENQLKAMLYNVKKTKTNKA